MRRLTDWALWLTQVSATEETYVHLARACANIRGVDPERAEKERLESQREAFE
jgi:hypothetical protein